jgi:Exocyst complex component Sec6
VRSNAVGQLQLTAQENRPGQMLLESRRGLIETYVAVMLPRLQAITDKVLNNLLTKRADIVAPMMNQRLGTTSPADLFTLMSEHLKIAKQGGSLTLQRKLLSLLMGEIARYSGQILLSHMEEWSKTPDTVDLDYVTACINDSGTMMDLLEQLEADFAPALAQVSAQAGSQISRLESRVGMDMSLPAALAQAQDDFDREEEEQAREDLAAIAQDIPRARNELKKCGTQLTGILLDIISDNLKAHFGKLFCGDWLKETNVVTSICNIASEYVSELQSILDAPWQELLFGWVLSAIVAHYTLRLVNPESVPRVFANVKFAGGFGRWFKLTDEALTKIVSDELEISQTFSLYLGNENRTLIMQALHTAREMLTSDPSILLDIFEMALRSHPRVSVETFLMFEKAVTMRSDYASSGTGSFISKSDKKKLLEDAKKLCFSYGQPLDDAEELLAMTDAYGRGVAITSGAAMASGHVWEPDSVTDTVMRILWPQQIAAARSKELFKGWVPPVSPTREEPLSAAAFGLGGGGAVHLGGSDDKPASFNLSDFTGKAGGGAGAASVPAAPSAGAGSSGAAGGAGSSSSAAFGLGGGFKPVTVADDDDDDIPASRRRRGGGGGGGKSSSSSSAAAPAPAPAPAPPLPEEKPKNAFLSSGGGGRRRRGRDDDDDD